MQNLWFSILSGPQVQVGKLGLPLGRWAGVAQLVLCLPEVMIDERKRGCFYFGR